MLLTIPLFIGTTEIVLIAALILLLFGGKKFPEMMKGLGQGMQAFKKGMNAKQCAGIIHTDFEKGFIRAEVMSYEDLIECGSELKVKEAGKARLEGKDYLMQDGDICHFRFNV